MAEEVKRKLNIRKMVIILLFSCALAIIASLIIYIGIIYNGQKLLSGIDPNQLVMQDPSIIYDDQNKAVFSLSVQNRQPVTFSEIPPLLINAVIATEDRRFMTHAGVDFISIGRALVKDVIARSAVEGGSTITQQLAKNLLFEHPQKTLFRKATEMSLAVALENKYTKDQIITMYLNRINFGSGAWGVKSAAQIYFGKNLKDLELWQIATLAAIPKSPTNYSPISYPENSKERRQVVLKLMLDQGYITQTQETAAMNMDYVPVKQAATKKNYLTYADYTLDEAQSEFGIDQDQIMLGGYKIYTAMNTNAQNIMEQTYNNSDYFQNKVSADELQSAMVIINYKDGGIKAMIGGRDYVSKGLNRVVVPQQPGSSFKPIVVYGPALETGNWGPYSLLTDDKVNFNGYSPRDFNGEAYQGQVTMFQAVKQSINIPAVWLLNQIGIKTGIQFAENLGITLPSEDHNLAIALGGLTNGATPLQMAQAYGAFANDGMLNKSHAITKIVAPDGEVFQYKKVPAKRVMSEKTAYYMTLLLESVIGPGGTGKNAKMNRPVAGKTGSTQATIKGLTKYNRDLWFVGYTPEWTAAVWMGFDKSDARHYVTIGSGVPATIFKVVMSKALSHVPVVPFAKPKGISDPVNPAMQAITDLSATMDLVNHKALLNWTAVADSKSIYQIYRKSDTESNFTKLMEVPSNQNVSDLSIVDGQTYQYYVVAYDADSGITTDKSNIVQLVVPLTEISPTPANNLSPAPSIGILPTDGNEPNNTQVPPATSSPSATPAASSTVSPAVSPTATPQ